MSQRRRMSRAQVERDPRREVRPGVSAATWWHGGVDALRAKLERRDRWVRERTGRVLVSWLIGRWRR
ncbi:MAG: hypothetical protein Q8S73_37045 [Deltaproteobacteria bacterium]|nr:hypothetical protein [Myxococcales bacterium]MDP3219768.1 hypothetical protein [Deltaproteobacteria bacterium]